MRRGRTLFVKHCASDVGTANRSRLRNSGSSEPIPDPFGNCRAFGNTRWGGYSVLYGALQRLGASPDGSGVVFEVNDEFSIAPVLRRLSPEQKGFFFVRSDGSERRRLGPPSRDPSFHGFGGFTYSPPVFFSPNGRRIAFTDLGPGPADEEAVQIVVVDLVTAERRQVTRLPSYRLPSPDFFSTCCPRFLDNETVLFQ